MLKTSFTLLASATLFAAPAVAADFAGPRAEIRLGFDKTTIDLGYDDGFDTASGSGHDSGFGLGAELGFDAALGSRVRGGVYAGVEGSTTKECSELFGEDEACLRLGRNFTAGARLGVVASPRIMVYAKGGYSNGQLRATYEDFLDSSYNFDEHANRGGFHVGGGVEVAVNASSYVRAEYVRTNYNDYRYDDGFEALTIDSHRDQLFVGFGLRF